MVTEQEVEAVGKMLVDPGQPLQARFRALFTLRGLGGPGAITWISRAFGDDSALLKHELAYCLGQMQDSRAIPVLVDVLRDTCQEPMVRHEAGERWVQAWALCHAGSVGAGDVDVQMISIPRAQLCHQSIRAILSLSQHVGVAASQFGFSGAEV